MQFNRRKKQVPNLLEDIDSGELEALPPRPHRKSNVREEESQELQRLPRKSEPRYSLPEEEDSQELQRLPRKGEPRYKPVEEEESQELPRLPRKSESRYRPSEEEESREMRRLTREEASHYHSTPKEESQELQWLPRKGRSSSRPVEEDAEPETPRRARGVKPSARSTRIEEEEEARPARLITPRRTPIWQEQESSELDFVPALPPIQRQSTPYEEEEEEDEAQKQLAHIKITSPRRTSSHASRENGANKTGKDAPANPEAVSEAEEDALFESGIRSLQDLLAPTSVEVQKNYICVEDRYIRYFSVVGLPRRLQAGWVEQLTKLKVPMQICFHFSPFDPGLIVRKLESRLVAIESKRIVDNQQGRIEKVQDDVGAEDIRRVLRDVEEGVARIFSMSLTIGLHAGTLERLDQRTHFLLTHLNQYRLGIRNASFVQDSGWRTCTPGPDLLIQRMNMDSGSMAMCMPFTSSTLGTGDGAFLGFSKNGEPMFFNPWSKQRRLPNGSIVVCGESGQGKSYLTKKLSMGLMSMGNVDCVVIDRDGDYDPLCAGLGEEESQFIKLAQGCPINPFDLPFTPQDVRDDTGHDFLSEHIDNSLLTFLTMLLTETTLDKHEEALVYQALVKTYTNMGITNDEILRDPETLNRPAPLFSDLIHTFQKMTQADAASLAERLEKSSYLFKHQTHIALDKPLTVFSIKGLDEAHYPLMIYTVKNFLNRNRAQLRYERFLLFLIEEASFMLRHPRGRKYLEESSRGVRKFGIAQATISQHPNDFLRDGEVIVANAGTCFFLGMEMSAIEKLKLTPQLERVLAQARPGDCVCRIGNEFSQFRVMASPEEHTLFTTDPHEQMEARARKKMREE